MLQGAKILITGPTGQVAFPIARELAKANDVYAVARFGDPKRREMLEGLGITCMQKSFAEDDLSDLPDDFTHVLHFAVYQEVGAVDFDYGIAVNAVGAGRLMSHCRRAKAFLHCSTTAVYASRGHEPFKESDSLLATVMDKMSPVYGISKIAGEAVAKFASQEWDLPTTIARLNVPYGASGGLPAIHLAMIREGQDIPLHPDKPSYYSPMHEEDYIEQAVKLLEVASVPPVVVNWCGSERVSAEEWCDYLGSLVGVKPKLAYVDGAIGTACCDTTLMHKLIGPTKVGWREGMRRMVEAAPSEGRRLEA